MNLCQLKSCLLLYYCTVKCVNICYVIIGKKFHLFILKLKIKCRPGFGATEPSCLWMWGGGEHWFYFCKAHLPKEEVPADTNSQHGVMAVGLTLTQVLQIALPLL